MVGAILTQNTSWANVKKAIINLKRAGMLNPDTILRNRKRLPSLIRPSGYYNIKAKRLKTFVRFLVKEYGSIGKMARQETSRLREELLSIPGIGRETADSILLYALNKKVFVVDAYTRRILYRHRMIKGNESYDDLRNMVERSFNRDIEHYKEFHALLVMAGKEYCRKNDPICSDCPLADLRHLS